MCLRKRALTADRLGSPGTLTRMCRRLRFGPVRAGLVAPFGVNGEIIFFVTAAAKLSTGLLGNSVAISPGSPDSQRILGVHGAVCGSCHFAAVMVRSFLPSGGLSPNKDRMFQVQNGCNPWLREPRCELGTDSWLGPDPSSYLVWMTIPSKKMRLELGRNLK